jgi:hypothetical protein
MEEVPLLLPLLLYLVKVQAIQIKGMLLYHLTDQITTQDNQTTQANSLLILIKVTSNLLKVTSNLLKDNEHLQSKELLEKDSLVKIDSDHFKINKYLINA